VGLAGSYGTSDLEFDSANSGNVDTFVVGGYGTFGLGGGYLDVNASVGFHDISTDRVTPSSDVASASYNGNSWSLAGEIGTVLPVGGAYVSPMLSLTYTGLSVDGFTETGAPGFNLVVDSADTDSIASVLGARAGNYFKVGKTLVNLQGNLGWRHEFGDNTSTFTGHFTEPAASSLLFNVSSSQIAEDSATFGVGTTVNVSGHLEVFLNYDGAWNSDANSHNGSLGVRANW
jgi:outer membrane autotransporter protein